jgi:hypothetical protein
MAARAAELLPVPYFHIVFIHHRERELGARRIQGVLSLAKKYGCA